MRTIEVSRLSRLDDQLEFQCSTVQLGVIITLPAYETFKLTTKKEPFFNTYELIVKNHSYMEIAISRPCGTATVRFLAEVEE